MKNIVITLILLAFSVNLKAQVGYNYPQYDLGFGVGINNRVGSDYHNYQSKVNGNVSFTYNYTPYLNYIIEYQKGSLAGDSLTFRPGYSYNDQYTSLAFRAQLQAGELIDYDGSDFNNAIKNLYLGAGVGVIYSNVNSYSFGALTSQLNTSNIFLPVKVGYEFKIFNDYDEPWVKIDLGYQINFTLTDKLDGLVSGSNKDGFSQAVINFKFSLGGVTSYRKKISY